LSAIAAATAIGLFTGPSGADAPPTGDFNGDGTSDILLENASGQLAEWTMQNGLAAGGGVIDNPSAYGFALA
jgi:hypothetical protein